jgi:hypothetical protein
MSSGLNDGIATPFVVFFLRSVGDLVAHRHRRTGGLVISLGVLVGTALAGGGLLAWGSRQGWASPSAAITVAGLALLACR